MKTFSAAAFAAAFFAGSVLTAQAQAVPGLNPAADNAEIKRSDSGVKTYVPLIGDDVTLTISAAFVQG